MICCSFKERLHIGDTHCHRTLPVSTNSDELGAPHWINYVQNLGAVLELGLSGLVDKQRNCDDVYIRQLPMLGTKPNSQVEIRRALSMSNVKCN